ncbi:MAG TPA: methyltransferase [Waterburya sp.]|jgi:hypothetical protein
MNFRKGAISYCEFANKIICQRVAGDFFESIPAGGDAYILKRIIHDWEDERAIAILQPCDPVMTENGKVLLVEQVI